MENFKQAKILVMGVGGGGCNAINGMIEAGVKSAEFIAVNTDEQALNMSKADVKIAIGKTTTKGLGAGARPDVGRSAAEESRDEIRKYLEDVDMLFITAGMGGGTGTGAAPVIAQIAREKNILTIGVVTKPFGFEAKVRLHNAEEGIRNLKESVDSLIVIPNDNLLKVLGNDVSFLEAFKHADSVLRDAIRGLADLIATPVLLNLDFADVKTIMQGKGRAHISVGCAEGKDKISVAVKQAICSQLCDSNIAGATGVLLSIVGGPASLGLKDVSDAANLVRGCISPEANLIFGAGLEENFGDKVQVLIVATGFEENKSASPFRSVKDGCVMSNEEFIKRLGLNNNVSDNKQSQQNGYSASPNQAYNPQNMYNPNPYQAKSYDQVYGSQAAQPAQPVQPVQPTQPQQENRRFAPWQRIMNNRDI